MARSASWENDWGNDKSGAAPSAAAAPSPEKPSDAAPAAATPSPEKPSDAAPSGPPTPEEPSNSNTEATETSSQTSDKMKGWKVAVAGATGGVGRYVVENLYTKGASVKAMARDTATATAVLPGLFNGVEVRLRGSNGRLGLWNVSLLNFDSHPSSHAWHCGLLQWTMININVYRLSRNVALYKLYHCIHIRCAGLMHHAVMYCPYGTINSCMMLLSQVVRGDVYQFASLPSAVEGCDAVICCTGARDPSNPFGPFNVDFQGTLNLIAAAKQKGVKRFVLVTSIGADDPYNPLNLFWGVLFWKKRAEEELQRSGLDYTIVRPGGLKTQLRQGESQSQIVMEGPNAFGFPPLKRSGSILRSQVAEVCVESLLEPDASGKVVEIIADPEAPSLSLSALFNSIRP